MITVGENPGEALIALRKKLGLSRKEMAERTGVSYTALCNWEVGGRGIKLKTLMRIFERLDVGIAFNGIQPNENYQWAAEQIEKGQRVRRKSWPRDLWVAPLEHWDFENNIRESFVGSSRCEKWEPNEEDLAATDWCLFDAVTS